MKDDGFPSGMTSPLTRSAREAADWLIRLSADRVEEQEFAAWMEWREADRANAQAFEEMHALWEAFGKIERPASMAFSRPRFSRLRPPSVPRLAWVGALAAGVAALAIWGVLALLPDAHGLRLADDGRLTTALSQNQDALLPDGSTVAVGASSSIALAYEPGTRMLRLNEGEAYFEVAPDRSRPFIVDAEMLQVRAIGTAFDVRRNDGRFVVTVTHGSVDVLPLHAAANANDSSAPVRVKSGQRLVMDDGGSDDGRRAQLQVTNVDTGNAVAWREGRLEYSGEPLSVVIANVNRYSRRPLVMEGPGLGTLSYTGTILVDAIDEWLIAIQRAYPVTMVPRADGALVIRRLDSQVGFTASTGP